MSSTSVMTCAAHAPRVPLNDSFSPAIETRDPDTASLSSKAGLCEKVMGHPEIRSCSFLPTPASIGLTARTAFWAHDRVSVGYGLVRVQFSMSVVMLNPPKLPVKPT